MTIPISSAQAAIGVAVVSVALALLSGCGGSDDDAAATSSKVRAAIASVDASVARVERQADRSRGPTADHARHLRAYLEKWHGTHTAVFAIDSGAARGRMQTVLDTVAGFSSRLVRTNAAGRPVEIDDDAVSRALTPDATTRAAARSEAPRIDHQVDVLTGLVRDQLASMPLGGGMKGTMDDGLIRLRDRLALLYPREAQRVLRLRLAMPR